MTDTPTREVPTVLVKTPPPPDNKKKLYTVKSPTGTPKVKPQQINWLLAGTVGVIAGLETCAQMHPDPTVQLVCRIGAVAVGAFAGVASPGYRKR